MLRIGRRVSAPWPTALRRCTSSLSREAAYRLVLGVGPSDEIHIAPEQAAAVEQAVAGYSVFVHLPTGAGKSLAFQVPALLAPKDSITLVVSPLIALMHDQVASLTRKGIDAVLVSADSMRSKASRKLALRDLLANKRLVYSTPEFLMQNGEMSKWVESLRDARGLNRIVLDEAHCVLEWGNTFRPSYLELGRWKARHFRDVPVTLATATVLEDDIHRLAEVFQTSIVSPGHDGIHTSRTADEPRAHEIVLIQQLSDRPNLRLEVLRKDTNSTPAQIQQRVADAPTIVYCLTRREADELCLELIRLGCHAGVYHGGIPHKRREFVRKQWMGGHISIICATSAFGMGIDRSDVRFVVHHSLPLSLSSYYQQIGRAGRDGRPATCVLFYAAEDKSRAHLITTERVDENDGSVISAGASHADVEEVASFCETTDCRRSHLATHFGHEAAIPCAKNCNCGSMEEPILLWSDIVREADSHADHEVVTDETIEDLQEKEPEAMEIEYYYQRVLAESKKQRLPKREALSRRAVREILRLQPTSEEEMAEVRGVGMEKAERYVSRNCSSLLRAELAANAVTATSVDDQQLMVKKARKAKARKDRADLEQQENWTPRAHLDTMWTLRVASLGFFVAIGEVPHEILHERGADTPRSVDDSRDSRQSGGVSTDTLMSAQIS